MKQLFMAALATLSVTAFAQDETESECNQLARQYAFARHMGLIERSYDSTTRKTVVVSSHQIMARNRSQFLEKNCESRIGKTIQFFADELGRELDETTGE